jgi:selenocysteine lyase/cysteine desulfurase
MFPAFAISAGRKLRKYNRNRDSKGIQSKRQEKSPTNPRAFYTFSWGQCMTEAFTELEQSVYAALETYSNVHRGSGHNSIVTTKLFEQARDIVLEHLGLKNGKYVVVFCTPRRADTLIAKLKPKSFKCLTSHDIGLPLGVRALCVKRTALPGSVPFLTGGGTARLVSPNKVTWAKAPDKFEAGTPAIVNIIAFAKALRLVGRFGNAAFSEPRVETHSASEILFHDELDGHSGKDLLEELKRTLIGQDLRVPTAEGVKPYVNLDNGASTRTFTPIWNVVCRAWQSPTQLHRQIVGEVKSICAGVLGAPPATYDCIFTSNTTEAINLVAESLSATPEHDSETVILNTLLEHNSNELPWRRVPGYSLEQLSVDAEGFIDLSELETLLRAYNETGRHGNKRIRLVAISGASNVLGTFSDLSAICRIAHKYGAQVLVDGAQLIAHRTVAMEKCSIDYLAFSAHKVYAPFGSGALIAKKGLLNFTSSDRALIERSGEENVGGIAALGKALVLLQRIGLEVIREEEQALTKRLLLGLSRIPGLTIYGVKDERSARFSQKGGVVLFKLKPLFANQVAKELAGFGIGVRYGCHCAHLLIKHLLSLPPLLQKLQHVILFLFPRVSLPGLVRVSLGIENDEKDIDALVNSLDTIATARKASSARQADINRQIDDFAETAIGRVYA